jgi:hypothetical protein
MMRCNCSQSARLAGWAILAVATLAVGLFPDEGRAALPNDTEAACRNDRRLANLGRVELRMKGKVWRDVFHWLTDLTGYPVVCTFLPTGTFTFVGPKGATYTIPEVAGIINRALVRQNNLRLHLWPGRSFALVSPDEPLLVRRGSPSQLPPVRPGQAMLPRRGERASSSLHCQPPA